MSNPKIITYNNYKIIISIFIFILLFFYLDILSFDHTPASDGRRTVPYLEFVAGTGQLLPTWNPYKLGGLPVLAEPYTLLWLSALTYFDESWIEFQVNAYHLLSIIAIGLATIGLLVSQGVRLSIAAILAFTLATSQAVITLQTIGVVPILFAYAAMISTLWIAISDAREPRLAKLGLMAILLGIIAVNRVHYALPFLLLLFATYIFHTSSQCSFFKRATVATIRLGACGVIGIASQAPFAVQMILFNAGHGGKLQPSWIYPFQPTALGSFFLPAHTGDLAADFSVVPSFAGLTLLVALGLFVAYRRLIGSSKNVQFWAGISFACLGLLLSQSLMDTIGILDWLHEHVPIIGRFRQPFPLFWLLTFSSVCLAAHIFELVGSADTNTGPPNVKAANVVIMVIGAVTVAHLLRWTVFGANTNLCCNLSAVIQSYQWPWAYMNTFLGLALVLVCLNLVTIQPSRWLAVLLLCAATQFVFLYSRVGAEKFNSRNMVTDNVPLLPAIYKRLRDDKGYFRVGCNYLRYGCLDNGLQGVQRLQGFSMQFPKAHRLTMALLRGEYPTVGRPHWSLAGLRCEDYGPVFSQITNLKYLVCLSSMPPKSGWREILSEKPTNGSSQTWVLWQRDDWVGKAPVFFAWGFAEDADQNWRAVPSKWSEGRAIITNASQGPLAGEPAKAPIFAGQVTALRSSVISLKVDTPRPGILVLPENYAPGWSVRVNGKLEKVYEVFGAFRGVFVPSGRAIVRFAYTPPYWSLSVAIGFSALLLCFGLMGSALIARNR